MDWNAKRITFNSKGCTSWVHKSSPLAYGVPEENGLEENVISGFSTVYAQKGQSANDVSVRVKRLSAVARVLTKGSANAAGHHLNAMKELAFLLDGKPLLELE